MTKRVLIIGGYGNFGSYIAKTLAKDDLQIIIGGRSKIKCLDFIEGVDDFKHPLEYSIFDITISIPFAEITPDIVIHTSGPYQEQGYDVAKLCIEYGCHYIDLADGREFVANIHKLDEKAKSSGVSVISGASSVPCLSSAIIEKYKDEFEYLEEIEYGIATAQQTNRGLATTASILNYTGKPFKTLINGKMETVYGWQDLSFHKYPEFGYRALGNCEIPDLELFPKIYPNLKTVRFYAGTEITFLHIGLWLLSWFVRLRIFKSLRPAAKLFVNIANKFDWIGSSNSAFHMILKGKGKENENKSEKVYILAKEGDGPFIPCAPAIILARKIAFGLMEKSGAMPCVGLIDLDEYMSELKDLNIKLICE
ncbi:saccharopine dehydrogenase family protein [Pseudemcibacter aquimaris]|uniref:saccharopine dehydrogenase family protein n=1 Tax=Pseudemcibacter aquimaris TaxID=2857064 RepID=UPI0020114B0F|nr:saccharopine dehydrogenase NADP-binding domain-containing protein [Pseudemcibacter aquimaris]MCC3862123.1 saccharopine dehydrogenase NADP-binding domain-containing protein [Pseudemcibacter aquimaris]WDU58876.1 saccharopine dehydrogenase NADP-binding domain-containing protein [Pseudemcibacter aquimaris]